MNKPNEPMANTYQFSSSSLMVGGAVIAGLVFIMSAGKGTVVARPEGALVVSRG